MDRKYYENKKVLIFGLGLLGGGLEAVKWFYKNGAILRITDLKKYNDLKTTIDKLEKFFKRYKNKKSKNIVKYILGKHRKEDIDWADIIYVNPGVSYKNEFVKYAITKNKEVVNDCYLFFKYAKGDIIAITGTRGKTTTTTWIYELLKNLFDKKVLLGGNQPDKSLFKIIDKTNKNSISVLELSSFQLEFYIKNGDFTQNYADYTQNYAELCRINAYSTQTYADNNITQNYADLPSGNKGNNLKAPKIAIITCLLRDHLNRYENMEEYAKAKANIFMNQTKDGYLILNYDNEWTKFFLKLNPKSQVYFVSLKNLPKNIKGIFVKNNNLIIRDEKEIRIFDTQTYADYTQTYADYTQTKTDIIYFREIYGEHNVYNLLFAVLAAYLYLKDQNLNIEKFKKYLQKQIFKLKTPAFRQEIVYQNKNLIIVNDSAATTPDATITAIRRFYNIRELLQNGRKLSQTYIDYTRTKHRQNEQNNKSEKSVLSRPKSVNREKLILITGGTDKKLDFKELAKEIKKKVKPENLFLLNGSATQKLIDELKKIKYRLKRENIFEDLQGIVFNIFNKFYFNINNNQRLSSYKENIRVNPRESVVILFSPASASFEKFKNEFDRGKKFNKLIKQKLKEYRLI